MNEQRIINLVDDLFRSVVETGKVLEQKEELRTHLIESVKDYMENGLSYDDAFEAAKNDLGDLDELISEFEHKKAPKEKGHSDSKPEKSKKGKKPVKTKRRLKRLTKTIVPLSPFIYLILGFTFGWWAWAWIIIPVISIITEVEFPEKIIAISPFVYLFLGFVFGWWAWGWIVIPVSAIVLSMD